MVVNPRTTGSPASRWTSSRRSGSRQHGAELERVAPTSRTEDQLYGPGTDSGTFDYFTEAVLGEEGASRADYSASEDDNVLVQGVKGDKGALGYFGYAYYEENRTGSMVAVDGGNGLRASERRDHRGRHLAPLSRPLFIYVKKGLARPAPWSKAFVPFFMENAGELVPAGPGTSPLRADQTSRTAGSRT